MGEMKKKFGVNAMETYGMPAIRLWNTRYTMCYNEPYENTVGALEMGLFQRMARNNATYVHERTPVEITNYYPQGNDGLMLYWDCSDDITDLTGFWTYFRGILKLAEKHYACIDYGLTYEELVSASDIRDMGILNAEQIKDCANKAEAMCDEVLENVKKDWYFAMHNAIDKYGDVVMEHMGRPSIHAGDLENGPYASEPIYGPRAKRKWEPYAK